MQPRSYFAYGSNMNAMQMANRCPNSEAVSVATLPDWRFRINTRGVATIVPEDAGAVHGILWRVTSSDEASLDRHEGVAAGHYQKMPLEIRLRDGTTCESFAYVAQVSAPGTPRPGYLESIIAAAVLNNFPLDYIAELRGWLKIDA